MGHQENPEVFAGTSPGTASLSMSSVSTTGEVGGGASASPSSNVGQRIRDVRKAKRIRQKVLARMVGISPGALTNFEKGRRRISLDWLQRIAEALDTPMAYFLPDEKDRARTTPGDPRERRLLNAWRQLAKNDVLRSDFLQLMEHLGRARAAKRSR